MYDDFTQRDAQLQLAATQQNAHRTVYGRSLTVIGGRNSVVVDGEAVAIGAAGYAQSVAAQIALFERHPGESHVELRPPLEVTNFDGWLALHTDGRLRIFSREHVRALMSAPLYSLRASHPNGRPFNCGDVPANCNRRPQMASAAAGTRDFTFFAAHQ